MRQGGHLPQDSDRQKDRKYFATSTIQLSSSITTIPPEPIIEPTFRRESKSTCRSRYCSGIQPPEGPPVCTALNFLLFMIPPPISNMISLRVIPIGTSTSPVFLTLPASEKTLVPE